ncbi:MAG: ImmA/IrrE family metallo-endopeptidase [Candidatus Thorarchaeota archaeon]|jgi:Zn-dependent peptidase ImmA (M78 family)
MVQQLPINPKTLKWARESANISVEEVAFRMKKATVTVEDWEKEGANSPTYVQLEKLAYEIYKRPIAIFFFPDPPTEVDPTGSFRTLPASELDDLPSTFLKLFRDAQAMQINLEELNDGTNPKQNKIFRDLSFSARDDAENMATAVREYLGITLEAQLQWKDVSTALKEWRKAIESKGIYVFKDAFRLDEISGFCIYDHEFPVIYLNNSMPMTRQVFTLFHELVHLLLKTGGIDKRNDAFLRKLRGDNKRAEVLCNKFAGAFLVPNSDFEAILQRVKLDEEGMQQLADRYRVSREVILRKCLDRKLIDRTYYERKSEQWTKEAQKRRRQDKGGDYYRNIVAYRSETYLDLAFRKYYQGHFDASQLSEYLGVKVTSIPGLESEYLSRT